MTTNYEGVAIRLEEAAPLSYETARDHRAIMGLLGYEVEPHGRLGIACRKRGKSHWGSLPDFSNAQSAELWLRPEKSGIVFTSIEQEDDGRWNVWCSRVGRMIPEGHSSSKSLGLAMFAAFVRAKGEAA